MEFLPAGGLPRSRSSPSRRRLRSLPEPAAAAPGAGQVVKSFLPATGVPATAPSAKYGPSLPRCGDPTNQSPAQLRPTPSFTGRTSRGRTPRTPCSLYVVYYSTFFARSRVEPLGATSGRDGGTDGRVASTARRCVGTTNGRRAGGQAARLTKHTDRRPPAPTRATRTSRPRETERRRDGRSREGALGGPDLKDEGWRG